MMKRILLILCIISSFNSKGTIHKIGVWGGYYEFVPASITIQLGDTLEWEPFAGLLPMMLHTITSDNIPVGAAAFDQVWQMPADTFFQYIPQVAGLYQYVCTPHIPMGMIGEFTVINGSNTQTYVPDDNFEAYLESNGMGNGIANDDYVTTANIDTVPFLDVSGSNINDLTGIQDFISVHHLWCDFNNLAALDVSSNTALVELYCGYNELSSLNIAGLTNLTNLRCENNQLTSLDVSIAISLTDLKCGINQISILNVSNNTALTKLVCDSNQLTNLDVRNGNNTNMVFYADNNPNLTCINVDDIAWSTANWTVYDDNIDSQHYFSTSCPPPTSIQEHSTNKKLLKVTDILGREVNEKRNTPLFYIYDDGTVEKKINIE